MDSWDVVPHGSSTIVVNEVQKTRRIDLFLGNDEWRCLETQRIWFRKCILGFKMVIAEKNTNVENEGDWSVLCLRTRNNFGFVRIGLVWRRVDGDSFRGGFANYLLIQTLGLHDGGVGGVCRGVGSREGIFFCPENFFRGCLGGNLGECWICTQCVRKIMELQLENAEEMQKNREVFFTQCDWKLTRL